MTFYDNQRKHESEFSEIIIPNIEGMYLRDNPIILKFNNFI